MAWAWPVVHELAAGAEFRWLLFKHYASAMTPLLGRQASGDVRLVRAAAPQIRCAASAPTPPGRLAMTRFDGVTADVLLGQQAPP